MVSHRWKFYSDRTALKSLLKRLKNHCMASQNMYQNTLKWRHNLTSFHKSAVTFPSKFRLDATFFNQPCVENRYSDNGLPHAATSVTMIRLRPRVWLLYGARIPMYWFYLVLNSSCRLETMSCICGVSIC